MGWAVSIRISIPIKNIKKPVWLFSNNSRLDDSSRDPLAPNHGGDMVVVVFVLLW